MALNLANIKSIGTASGTVIKKVIQKSDGKVLWQAAAIVSYVVDTGVSYTEEVASGATCLSPKTFTPAKSGWTFIGWREDGAANSSVLTSKVMGSDPIVLYAVYKKTCSAKFISYNSTQTATGTAYYNGSGQVSNFTVTAPTGATYSGWTWRGWSGWYDTSANGSVAYANGASISIHPDNDGIPFYGLYQLTHTVTFVDWNGSAATYQYAYPVSYYNAAGNTKHSNATGAAGGAYSGYNFCGWSPENSTAIEARIGHGDPFEVSYSHTRYAVYQKTLTVSFNGNGSTGGSVASQYVDQYVNVAGTWLHPTITLPANGFSRNDYNFTHWTTGSDTWAVGSSATIYNDTTFYAVWALAAKQLYPNGVLNNWYGDSPDGGISVTTLTCPDDGYADNTGYGHSLVPVDLTNYTTLTIKYRTSAYFEYNSSVSASVLFYTNPYEFLTSVSSTALVFENNNATSRTITIDVSNLNQSLYIGFHIYAICRSSGNTQSGILYIDDVKLT